MKFIVRKGTDPVGRADAALLRALGLPGGGIVAAGSTHVLVGPGKTTPANGLLLGERTLVNAGLKIGDSVDLKRALLPEAHRVVISKVDADIDARHLARSLQGSPVTEGDAVAVQTGYGGDRSPEPVVVTITAVTPGPAAVVGNRTVVHEVGEATPDVVSQPAGSQATLVNQTTQVSQFVADQVGVYIAQLIADDWQLGSEPDTVTVTAVNQVPVCEQAIAQPNALWPPNHKFITITLQGITDPDGDALTLNIAGISQDEPVNAAGVGNTGPDAIIVGDQVQLRSERAAKGNGRVYSIYFTADDGVDQCTGSVSVSVPHSRKDNAIDDGQNYDATR